MDKIDYLTNVIKETLRFHTPAVGLFPREALKDLYIDDLFIKKGELVDVSIFTLK